jgi:proline iminopeptidase
VIPVPLISLNGTDLFYTEAGAGLPCLVMHGGLGLDHTSMHPSLGPLGDRLHLIYYDHRGNGRSGRPPVDTLTFPRFAADADALRAALGHERVVVLGHSYGSFIALEYALTHPGRVSHLILIGTAPAWDYGPEVLHNVHQRGATPEVIEALGAQPRNDEEMARIWHTILPLYFHRYDAGVADLFRETHYSATAMVRGAQLLPHYNLTLRLSELHVPALILVGRHDFITPPRQAERLQASLSRAHLVTFDQSGHYPWVEEPDKFFAVVRGWLAENAK